MKVNSPRAVRPTVQPIRLTNNSKQRGKPDKNLWGHEKKRRVTKVKSLTHANAIASLVDSASWKVTSSIVFK